LKKEHGYEYNGKNLPEDYNILLMQYEAELVFDFIETYLANYLNAYYHPLYSENSANRGLENTVFELNRWFKEAGYGYEINSKGLIERIDSEYLKEETTKKALQLLEENEFVGPLEEFEKAIHYQRAMHTKEAVQEANKALESTMKAILEKSGQKEANTWDTGRLTQELRSMILDSQQTQMAGQIQKILESLSALRSTTPGVGHGQGGNSEKVPDSYSTLAIHLAGTLIVFLIQRWQEAKK